MRNSVFFKQLQISHYFGLQMAPKRLVWETESKTRVYVRYFFQHSFRLLFYHSAKPRDRHKKPHSCWKKYITYTLIMDSLFQGSFSRNSQLRVLGQCPFLGWQNLIKFYKCVNYYYFFTVLCYNNIFMTHIKWSYIQWTLTFLSMIFLYCLLMNLF